MSLPGEGELEVDGCLGVGDLWGGEAALEGDGDLEVGPGVGDLERSITSLLSGDGDVGDLERSITSLLSGDGDLDIADLLEAGDLVAGGW